MRETKDTEENGHFGLCHLSLCQEQEMVSELASWRAAGSPGCSE